MSTAAATLQTGVNAVTQGRFSDAIAILESLCNGHLRPPSQDYYQARMWLIRAYRESGQFPQAIKLCRQLATSSHPQVQPWAQKILPELRNPSSVSSAGAVALPKPVFEPSNQKPSNKRLASTRLAAPQTTMRSATSRPLSQIEADKLLHCGVQAIRRQKYPEAVKSLEAFMRGVETTHPNINYAQTSLAKAYMGNGQNKLALQLARKLLKSENIGAQAWARQFIETHDPRQSDRSLATQADRAAAPSPPQRKILRKSLRQILGSP
ncbi:MAG: tetratricopeptide repeat protein [Cyanobacteria bacterium P01_G01_bin.38]